ncbi:MAG: cytochrome c oxidase accessory protein CcoG [Phycisphaeraceae bacterium]|nr:MAG: cytochrome c oxidase accessory protein CcoG [Phycisphaeraceae bacterium]
MSDSLIQAPDRVLSTLNQDGSRRWLRPRPSRGTFWKWRRPVSYLLIVLFTALPWININGKPAVFLDILHREFTFFGLTLLPTDTLLLAFMLIGVFLTVFLVTAMFGRVWCGWMCPQTVYLEFVYRPLERLFEGDPSRRKVLAHAGWRKVARFAVYLAVSAFLAHTFLSYFVGVSNLRAWIFGSPFQHPVAFMVMAGTTLLMLFDFGYFREQVCVVVCPYARLQSALLDRDSLIISYDRKRGEPRGRRRAPRKGADVALPVLAEEPGDCVDCHKCVTTCPTGIDIRDGLQLECIGCAQCIDACNDVMGKIGREPGLIRYTSQRAVETGTTRLLRARVLIYPVLLLLVFGAFGVALVGKEAADVQVLRAPGLPFNTMASGEISNQLRIRITNRTDADEVYSVSVVGAERVHAVSDELSKLVPAGEQRSASVVVAAPADVFVAGKLDVTIRVEGAAGFVHDTTYRLLGPATRKEDSDG